VERAAELGSWLDDRLRELVAAYPAARGTRGLGLMRALELADPDTAARLATRALRAGVIVLPEASALAFTPPLVITEAQLGHAVGVLAELVSDAGA
jgi:4-aminobutyrate aminotransferase-like enzyme